MWGGQAASHDGSNTALWSNEYRKNKLNKSVLIDFFFAKPQKGCVFDDNLKLEVQITRLRTCVSRPREASDESAQRPCVVVRVFGPGSADQMPEATAARQTAVVLRPLKWRSLTLD